MNFSRSRVDIRLGTNLQISYFDQLREQLDENKTVQENVVEDKDSVTINGKKRHIIGYLQDFLFSPDQARSYVSLLSGGERNRLLLARLFTRPSNLLVLDEPTNDLDMETLELLEDYLMNYTGTVLLVSHDRAFINNVVTSTLVFEGDGVVKEYVGGYDDWLRQRPAEAKPEKAAQSKKETPRLRLPGRSLNSDSGSKRNWTRSRRLFRCWKQSKRSYTRPWAIRNSTKRTSPKSSRKRTAGSGQKPAGRVLRPLGRTGKLKNRK